MPQISLIEVFLHMSSKYKVYIYVSNISMKYKGNRNKLVIIIVNIDFTNFPYYSIINYKN